MVREVKDAGFVLHGGWFRRRYAFEAGRHRGEAIVTQAMLDAAAEAQRTTAVPVLNTGERQFWWCRDRFYAEADGLEAEDVHALVFERDRRRERMLARAHAVVCADALPRRPRREAIPREVRRAVFERDGGRCAECGSAFDLQYDHLIPVARGGASTAANLQVLCAPCNQAKGVSVA